MMTDSTAQLGLSNNWLDQIGQTAFTNGAETISHSLACYGSTGDYYHYGYWTPWTYPITQYVTREAKPIKLKLSEIDRLRKAAKADKALKEILAKFTDQIEITVDFE